MPDDDPDLSLDAAGLEEVVKAARGGSFAELGSTGLRHSGGFVLEEFLRQLQGDRAIRVFREMADNDPVIGAMLFAVDMMVRQVEWRVEPPEANSVEEILAQRQADRAQTIQAAQAADLQRQQQQQAATALSQGQKPDGTPLFKPDPNKPGPGGKPDPSQAKEKVQKALDAFGLTLTADEWLAHLADVAQYQAISKAQGKVANDPGTSDPNPAKAKAKLTRPVTPNKTPPPPTVPGPGKPIDTPLDPKLQGDPMDNAVIEGEDIAIFIETCLHDMSMSWEDTLTTILSMLPYGWHTAEIVYKKRMGNTGNPKTNSKYDDGKIGWRYFPPRSQDTRQRWDIDLDDGSVKGMWQFDPSSSKGIVYIPVEKMLLFRTENRKGNPEGRSILRNAYRPWFFKKRIEEIEAIGIERDLAGLPVAHVPYQMLTSAATTEELSALAEIKKIVRNIKRDEQEGIIFPTMIDPESKLPLFTLELLSTGGTRQFDVDKVLQRYDQRIVMCILADFILIGHENVGSRSLAKAKIDFFTAALESWLDSIAEVFNTYAIPRLLKMNGMDPAASPKLTHGKLAQVDLVGLGTFIQSIATAGAPLFPDDALESYLRDVAGMPAKEGGDDI